MAYLVHAALGPLINIDDTAKNFYAVEQTPYSNDLHKTMARMSGDISAARAILQRNEPLVRYLFQRKYYHPAIINATWRMIMEGASKFLPSLSIENNWKLNSVWNKHSEGREEINYSTFARTLA